MKIFVHGVDAVSDDDDGIVASAGRYCGSQHATVRVNSSQHNCVDIESVKHMVEIGRNEAVIALFGGHHEVARLEEFGHDL